MPKFRKKPEVIEAMQLSAQNREEICKWINGGVSGASKPKLRLKAWYYDDSASDELYLDAIDCTKCATTGDYIIKHENGLVDAWEQKQFESLYERVAD